MHPSGFVAAPAETLFAGSQGPFHGVRRTRRRSTSTTTRRPATRGRVRERSTCRSAAGCAATSACALEHGFQDVPQLRPVRSERITAEGDLDNTDWLPSGNLDVGGDRSAQRCAPAASRTLSRPDLNELSPSPALEYVGGFQVHGQPRPQARHHRQLRRARRGVPRARPRCWPPACFYKKLHEPIEQVIQGGSPTLLVPAQLGPWPEPGRRARGARSGSGGSGAARAGVAQHQRRRSSRAR